MTAVAAPRAPTSCRLEASAVAAHGPVLAQLEAVIAAHPALLRAYRSDFDTIDTAYFRSARAGDVFVWLLRECGTELFRCHIGGDRTTVAYWLASSVREALPPERATRAYRVDVTAASAEGPVGTVTPLSNEAAIALASEPLDRTRVLVGTPLVAPQGLTGRRATNYRDAWEAPRRAPRDVIVTALDADGVDVAWQDGETIVARVAWEAVQVACLPASA